MKFELNTRYSVRLRRAQTGKMVLKINEHQEFFHSREF